MKTYLYDEEKQNVTTMSNVISSFAVDYFNKDTGRLDKEQFTHFINGMGLDSQMRVMVLDRDVVVLYDCKITVT